MIVWLNGREKEFDLSNIEKAEISKVYQKGGRYLFFSRVEREYIEVYDDDENGKPKQLIGKLYGSIVNVLQNIYEDKAEGFKSIISIMQKFDNKYSVNLTEHEKDCLKATYNSGGRYLLLSSKYIYIHNEKKEYMTVSSGDVAEAVLKINEAFPDEYLVDSTYLDLTVIIRDFCD
ncbi:MAG: hypothetical protein IKV94_05415 [Clostridia bacterium]|nr:hypothetical protein [Clostridia bacterium]